MPLFLLRILNVISTSLNYVMPSNQSPLRLSLRHGVNEESSTSSKRSTGEPPEPSKRYQIHLYHNHFRQLLIHDTHTNLRWVNIFKTNSEASQYCLDLYSGEIHSEDLQSERAPAFLISPSNSATRFHSRPRRNHRPSSKRPS